MGKRVSRTMRASKEKIQDVAQKQTMPDSPSSPELRKSPAGKRLAALRKRKRDGA